jgi:hypothetical protein
MPVWTAGMPPPILTARSATIWVNYFEPNMKLICDGWVIRLDDLFHRTPRDKVSCLLC